MPDVVNNNEAKPAIIQIRVINPAGVFEQTLKCKRPQVQLASDFITNLNHFLHNTQAQGCKWFEK